MTPGMEQAIVAAASLALLLTDPPDGTRQAGAATGSVVGRLVPMTARHSGSRSRIQRGSRRVTIGHIRGHGCRDLLVYCGSGRACTRCGYIGADVRPDWSPHVNKRRV
jgi:hypothetical protein